MAAKPKIKVILDPQAGICGGVRRAIELAEEELADETERDVYVLGDIIHNEREVDRLDHAGLKTLYKDNLAVLNGNRHKPVVLVRAHGEPPGTFKQLQQTGVAIIDGTCPVVKRSQDLAHKYFLEGYQVVIVGKHRHPEVIGILGYTDNTGKCVQYEEDINALSPQVPTLVLAQTTINSDWFEQMVKKITTRVKNVEVKNTICRFVVRRNRKLPEFARQADVILVVGGHKSSNTKMLHKTCQEINPDSHHVVRTSEIDSSWFINKSVIGVTGSASTPLWLLHEFVETLNDWIKDGTLDR